MGFRRRLRQLEAALSEQRVLAVAQHRAIEAQHGEIERLRETIAHSSPIPATSSGDATDSVHAPRELVASSQSAPKGTRRALLKGGAVAAGATLAGALAAPKPAAAADGNNLVIAADNTSTAGDTRLRTTVGALLTNANILTSSSGLTSSLFPSAIGGIANGGRVANGVYGYTDHSSDISTTGHALVGRREGSARSNLLLSPSGQPPTSDVILHRAGSVRVDSDRNMWFCVEGGTPGIWRRVAGPQSSGALHLITPSRVYDSRFGNLRLTGGTSRIISVADRINVTTGAIEQFNLVPSGATAVMFNVTITATLGSGFLTVAPGTQLTVTASTINWTMAAQVLANGSVSTVDTQRRLNILSGGGGSTHFIIDITGYTV